MDNIDSYLGFYSIIVSEASHSLLCHLKTENLHYAIESCPVADRARQSAPDERYTAEGSAPLRHGRTWVDLLAWFRVWQDFVGGFGV